VLLNACRLKRASSISTYPLHTVAIPLYLLWLLYGHIDEEAGPSTCHRDDSFFDEDEEHKEGGEKMEDVREMRGKI